MKEKNIDIAYFSMEIALEDKIKTYSGGLGVLAGDTLRQAADMGLSMLGVTLLSRKGYFKQVIEGGNKQKAESDQKDYNFKRLKKLSNHSFIKINKDRVRVNVWLYEIKGKDNNIVPIYLLDTNDKSNKLEYRSLTDNLYGGNKDNRLLQEIILGRAGYQVLKDLAYNVSKFHINEGHGSFVAIAKYLDLTEKNRQKRIESVRNACVFTTHTPVKEGHDIFSLKKVKEYQKDFPINIKEIVKNNQVNMTEVALFFSHYKNAVAKSHAEVSSKMFPHHSIDYITNGVHSATWTYKYFAKLFDKHINDWRYSNLNLRNAIKIPLSEIWKSHQLTKADLIKLVKKETGIRFSKNTFTIGFARRFTAYKRSTLLISDMKRLLQIHKSVGSIQIVYAGKAHPRDKEGQKMISEVLKISKKYQKKIKIAFIPNYSLDKAKVLTAGVDLWLNTPLPPNEASGTSGMKAAHNGVPQLSSLDGWWHEGYIKGKTGWVFIKNKNIYNLLAKEIIPLYYNNRQAWQKIMRNCLAINASFFNTDRMLKEYIQKAYFKK